MATAGDCLILVRLRCPVMRYPYLLVEVEVQLHDFILDELHHEIRVSGLTLTDGGIDIDLAAT